MSKNLDLELLNAIKNSGYTQAEIAERSGISLGSLKQMIRRKKFKAHELGVISEAIGYQVYLMPKEEENPERKELKNTIIEKVVETINQVFE